VISRRGHLLAELFLQDLDPEFVARPTADFGYDFFVGFRNSRGGINNVGVKVKATEQLRSDRLPVPRDQFNTWTQSNIPILLIVADVKENRLFYALPSREGSIPAKSRESKLVAISLSEIREDSKRELRARLMS
jgi:hypothetical protein